MGLFSNLYNLFKQKPEKTKSFVYINDNNLLSDYEKLTERTDYLSQYIGWTYKAASIRAKAAAKLEPKHFYKNNGKIEEIAFDKSKVLTDLWSFNKFQTLYQARELIHLHLALTGVAFVYIIKGITTNEFYILNPENITIGTDKNGLPKYYKYTDVNNKTQQIPAENVLVFKETNPKNWLKGYSPLEAAKLAHNSYEYAMMFNANMFLNQGKMQGILTIQGANQSERRRIERLLQKKFQGIANAKRMMVTGEEVKWQPISNTPADMEYIAGLHEMRDQILSFFGVPPQIALAEGTYNNTKEAQRIFAEYTIDPLLKMEASVYTEQLLPHYYDEPERQRHYIEFASSIEIDEAKKAEIANLAFQKGTITLNEARRMQGLDDDPANGNLYIWEIPKNQQNNQNQQSEQKNIKIKSQDREKTRQKLLQKTAENEVLLLEITQQFFKDQYKRVIAKIKPKKAISTDIEIDLQQEILELVEAYRETYYRIAEEFNGQVNELLDKQEKLKEETKKQLEQNLLYFANEVNQTTLQDIRDLISDAIENNLDLDTLKLQIKKLFDEYVGVYDDTQKEIKLSRAETIARTETSKIKNFISYSRYSTDEDVKGYEWLATGGVGSRPWHNAVDGVRIKKGEMFLVGGEYMRYPHDPNASAKNVVNCRCDILPVL